MPTYLRCYSLIVIGFRLSYCLVIYKKDREKTEKVKQKRIKEALLALHFSTNLSPFWVVACMHA